MGWQSARWDCKQTSIPPPRARSYLLQPGGALVVTTINRTLASFGLAIVAAEYVLRAVPAGTHEWARFVTPEELRSSMGAAGLAVVAETGLWYDPLAARWSVSAARTGVNYAMVGLKRGGSSDGAPRDGAQGAIASTA